MKVLYPDRTLAILAGSSDSNFPVSNLLDGYSRHVWRSTGLNDWVRVWADARCSGVALAGTNAYSITITVYRAVSGVSTSTGGGGTQLIDASAGFVSSGVTAGAFVWNHTSGQYSAVVSVDSETKVTVNAAIFPSSIQSYSIELDPIETKTVELDAVTTYYGLMTDDVSIGRSLTTSYGLSYDYQYYPHHIKIDFFAGNNVECGIVRVGEMQSFPSPMYGLKEGLQDYSVIKQLNNGAIYLKKRDIVRTFSGAISMQRDASFYQFMRDIVRSVGQDTVFWWITDMDHPDWVVYGRCNGMPEGVHQHPSYSIVNFSIIESI